MKSIKLVVVGGDVEAKEMQLDLPATIGRGREASISLTHPLVSRKHCEIVTCQGRVLVRDLESLNGTFVGSERVNEAILHPGDLLTVGTVTFRAVYQETEKANTEPGDSDPSELSDEPMQGTASLANPIQDTLRVDSPQESPAAHSPPSDTPHAAEYDT